MRDMTTIIFQNTIICRARRGHGGDNTFVLRKFLDLQSTSVIVDIIRLYSNSESIALTTIITDKLQFTIDLSYRTNSTADH